MAEPSKYAHSPVHRAILTRDYAALKSIEIRTEEASMAEEEKADAISAGDPLHLAVKLADATATEMLMLAGADWSLQNEQGWSALQEAICMREEKIAKIIVRHYQPLAWAKWCRRLPRVVATMGRMRDFYMEITFHFESSVIPFISRVAPSDTYRIWKRGSNLRADMTLAGFDGFRIQRSDQSVLFFGDGSEDGKVPPGSLCMISHRHREVINALDGAGAPATEAEIEQEVSAMSQTNIFRPGIDVTRAALLPQLTWRRQEKVELVGQWKARVYDMHHVVVSMKSRRVPGAMTDDELFSSSNDDGSEEEYDDILTKEERDQLEMALKVGSDVADEDSSEGSSGRSRRGSCEEREIPIQDASSYNGGGGGGGESRQAQKGWFRSWGGRGQERRGAPPRNSVPMDGKVGDSAGNPLSASRRREGKPSLEVASSSGGEDRKNAAGVAMEAPHQRKDSGSRENEYRRGLRPVLWLSPDFPLQTEELLPLLDILANKVKAIRRLRELLTTKLPPGTFPVKVAIPVIPTIRVLVTFTKFEELQPDDEFSTPPSSPENGNLLAQPSSSSWVQWMKASYKNKYSAASGASSHGEDVQDPFLIPSDYSWITPEAKKKRLQEKKNKNKSKKGRSRS
ncbi:unnamed protein product [Spirodela intermedia]|uniref:Ankyrin repeat domain-containing protein n=1 Tax=Spirodela intermedia TaxID=51605 RepID=A0A7I8JAM1_SPIIN|nr:unnamed protein product [Spirodela intermedia]CAA6666503.1 unnamed protein product [Spirodela intermedia]